MKMRADGFMCNAAIVAVVALTTTFVVKHAIAGGYPPCTTYHAPCAVTQDWSPGGICCLNIGGFQTNKATGQTLGATPVTPAAQCGAKFQTVTRPYPPFIFPCSSNIGNCGGAQHSPLCS